VKCDFVQFKLTCRTLGMPQNSLCTMSLVYKKSLTETQDCVCNNYCWLALLS